MRRLVFVIFLFLCSSQGAAAFGVIADVSPNRIDIHSKFAGKEILVFGVLTQEADKVVIVVHGPKKDTVVRKKYKLFGLWVNGRKLIVNDFPQFFSFSSSTKQGLFRDYVMQQISPFVYVQDNNSDADQAMREALLQNRRKLLLYQIDNEVRIINDQLFRGYIKLPGNIVNGVYTVEVIALKGNKMVSLESIPLFINKIGIDAWISDLSHNHSFLYGILCVCGGLAIGWFSFMLLSILNRGKS